LQLAFTAADNWIGARYVLSARRHVSIGALDFGELNMQVL
jgi:hypothetical protein